MVSGIISQAYRNYFSGYSDLPLKSKVARVALPTIVGLAVLGAGIALAYYLWVPAKPKPHDLEEPKLAPLMLSEIQLNEATPKAVRDHKTQAYQLVLDEIFPLSVSHPYIIAQTAATLAQRDSFYRLAAEEAGLIISIGSPENFNFFKEGSMAAGPYLEFISGPKEVTPRCTSYQFNFKTLPSSASESQRNTKTLWHLNIGLSSETHWLEDLHHIFDVIDQFIDQNKISFENRSLVVTSRSRDDQAGIFIVFHQLYHHCKKLVEKELKDNPGMTNEQIADKILKDIDITQLIEQRSRLIKKLSRDKFKIEQPLVTDAQYRNIVLLNMIDKMRGSLKTPASRADAHEPPASSTATLAANEQITNKLNTLSNFDRLFDIDPHRDWAQWDRFISQMNTCYSQLTREGSLDFSGSIKKICDYFSTCKYLDSLSHYENFYKALQKALELNKTERKYYDNLLIAVQGVITFKLREQGYDIFHIRESGQAVTRFHTPLLLEALKKWYQETGQAVKAKEVQTFMENNAEDLTSISTLLQPLADLENGAKTSEQLPLLKLIIPDFEKQPKKAVKDYLSKVLDRTSDIIFMGLVKNADKVQQPQGSFFVLIGDHLIKPERITPWLERLYQQQISSASTLGLSPSLYAEIKIYLERILGNEEYINTLYGWPQGRLILGCMWLQMDEKDLIAAVPLIFKESTHLETWMRDDPLVSIWENFASDAARIERYPDQCDKMLEKLFKLWYSKQPWENRRALVKSSYWATLQQNNKLPYLRTAFRQVVPADSSAKSFAI